VIPIDLAKDRALAPVTFPRLVLQFTITPSGRSAWVFLGGTLKTAELVKVNLATWATSAPIKLPGTEQVAFGPGDATAYAFGGDEVTPVELATRTLGTPIKVSVPARAWPDRFSLSPDGRTGIVYNLARNRGVEITSVNLAHGTALSPVYLGYQGWWPIHVTFAPDSRTAYVSIVTDASGGRWAGKQIPVSAATGKRAGRSINIGGQSLQVVVTR
jgi:DNA-binding beta-propeller fold protein YncE